MLPSTVKVLTCNTWCHTFFLTQLFVVQEIRRRVRGDQEAEAWVHGGAGSGRGPLEAALFQECGRTWPRQVEEASSACQPSHGAARWHGARSSVSARGVKVLPRVYGNPCQRRQHRSHNFFIFKINYVSLAILWMPPDYRAFFIFSRGHIQETLLG